MTNLRPTARCRRKGVRLLSPTCLNDSYVWWTSREEEMKPWRRFFRDILPMISLLQYMFLGVLRFLHNRRLSPEKRYGKCQKKKKSNEDRKFWFEDRTVFFKEEIQRGSSISGRVAEQPQSQQQQRHGSERVDEPQVGSVWRERNPGSPYSSARWGRPCCSPRTRRLEIIIHITSIPNM